MPDRPFTGQASPWGGRSFLGRSDSHRTERNPNEVLGLEFMGERVTPQNAKARNIAFDVTPNRLVTAIVTENGVVYPPFDVNLRKNVLGK